MARQYRLTEDASEKEKAVGGVLTFAQVGWLAAWVLCLGVPIFMALYEAINPIAALIIAVIPGGGLGCLFAFWNRDGLSTFQYIVLKTKYKIKVKQLPNTLSYRIDRPADFAREQKGADRN